VQGQILFSEFGAKNNFLDEKRKYHILYFFFSNKTSQKTQFSGK
jgi:hypothetical protein